MAKQIRIQLKRRSTDKFHSEPLSKRQIRQAMVALPNVFRSLVGDCIVTAYYEFGCEIHPELWYKPMRVGIGWLDRFIKKDSLGSGIVVPGNCDFAITVQANRLKVLFCHEHDIHLSGRDDALIQRFLATPPFSSMRFRPRATATKADANGAQ